MEAQKKQGDVFFVLCLAVFVGHIALAQGIYAWWALGVHSCSSVNTEACPECSALGYLDDNQTALCRQHGDSDMVKAISKGTVESIWDCQRQFSNWRWGCSTFKGENLFGLFVENCTRETAVLNAYMSAGAAHGIATACHNNLIDGCRCTIPTTTIREDGVTYLHACGDDVEFAISFLRRFSGTSSGSHGNANPTPSPTPTPEICGPSIDTHNNDVGYKAVDNRQSYCRCTGLSGSCVLQTCYQRAPAIEEVGASLRIRYDGAQEVADNNGILTKKGRNEEPQDTDLVYTSDTPSLCEPIPEIGILGTTGRLCDPMSYGTNGCNIMCCGRGFETFTRYEPIEDCKFVWCCSIECDIVGNKTITEYRCR